MQSLIERIDTYLKSNEPEIYSELNDAASDSEISELEEAVNLKLPKGLILLLKWRDGLPRETFKTMFSLKNERFLPIEEIVELHQEMGELLKYEDIEPESWSNQWLPFTDDYGDNNTCIDLTPTGNGRIIFRDHEIDNVVELAPSISDWLTQQLKALKA